MELPANCNLFLLTTPEKAPVAFNFDLPLAHFAYRIGQGPHLYRTDLRYSPKGGILVADIKSYTGEGRTDHIVREVEQECLKRSFRGVFFDFESVFRPELKQTLEQLAPVFQNYNWTLFLPESYAFSSPAVKIVIPTAISGGSLRQWLLDQIQVYGSDRLAVGLEWTAMDFTLPAYHGQGKPLDQKELASLRSERGNSVYFSDELCAHYFTYMNTGSDAHFVLYDDGASVARKLRLAASLGISDAFLPIPEEISCLEELLGKKKCN